MLFRWRINLSQPHPFPSFLLQYSAQACHGSFEECTAGEPWTSLSSFKDSITSNIQIYIKYSNIVLLLQGLEHLRLLLAEKGGQLGSGSSSTVDSPRPTEGGVLAESNVEIRSFWAAGLLVAGKGETSP